MTTEEREEMRDLIDNARSELSDAMDIALNADEERIADAVQKILFFVEDLDSRLKETPTSKPKRARSKGAR